jgi:hypothetical protein
MWEDIANAAEYAKGAGLKKTTRGRKKKELVAHEVLLKELEKVKAPVKSQRRANKKQDALNIEDFVSKVKAKDQVTQLLDGIRIKRALDAQYKKLSDKAAERLKQDIIDKTSKSKDREVSERIKEEDLKVITDKRDAELLALDEAKYQKQLRRERVQRLNDEIASSLVNATKARAQLALETTKERARLALEANKESAQLAREDARDRRRELSQDQRQRDIEQREEATYQQRQTTKIMKQRGRPIGSYSTLGVLADDEGNFDATYSSVSREDLVKEAKALKLSTKGTKDELARRIVNSKSGKQQADDLFDNLTAIANIPHNPISASPAIASAPIAPIASAPIASAPSSPPTALASAEKKKKKKAKK